MTPFALGNDLGGSVRSPAWGAGVCALKPTHGRVPGAGLIPPVDDSVTAQVMASTGPLARCISDLRLGLQVLNGRHRRDPRSVDVTIDGPPVPLTAALVTDVDVPPEYAEAVRTAGRALEAAGYQVVEATPPGLDVINLAWAALLQMGFTADLPALRDILTPALLAQIEAMIATPKTMPAPAAFVERHRMQREWSEFFASGCGRKFVKGARCPGAWIARPTREGCRVASRPRRTQRGACLGAGRPDEPPVVTTSHSVIVGPVWTDSLFPHDADLDVRTGWQTSIARLRFITPGNLLGIPSTVVPTGIAADGHPPRRPGLRRSLARRRLPHGCPSHRRRLGRTDTD